MKVDAPLADFSLCHLGILSQLKAFAALGLALHIRHAPYVVGHV